MSPVRRHNTVLAQRPVGSSSESLAIAGELRVVLSRLTRRTRTAIGDLTPSQLSALTVLDDGGPLRLHELAAREGVTAPTMSRVVDALANAGLVDRERDPADARSSFISVSTMGKATIDRFLDSRTQLFGTHLDTLGGAERAAIAAALPALRALVDSFSAIS
jgi:DNA-binding MarR family transcriptional regulator